VKISTRNLAEPARYDAGVRSGLLFWTLVFGVVGLSPASRSAAALAFTAQALRVTIDVKPGDTPTSIEPRSGGMLPIAVLTTKEFAAATVDASTVTIGPEGTEAEPFRSMAEDVDRDGRPDLLILVRIPDLKIKCGDTTIRLKGKTSAGTSIEGSESVLVEGCQQRQ